MLEHITQAIAAGSATLKILDAAGSVMYEEDIAEEKDAITPEGVAGTWRIEVVLAKTTGTFNFRAQKTTEYGQFAFEKRGDVCF